MAGNARFAEANTAAALQPLVEQATRKLLLAYDATIKAGDEEQGQNLLKRIIEVLGFFDATVDLAKTATPRLRIIEDLLHCLAELAIIANDGELMSPDQIASARGYFLILLDGAVRRLLQRLQAGGSSGYLFKIDWSWAAVTTSGWTSKVPLAAE